MLEMVGKAIDSGTYLGFIVIFTLLMFIVLMRSFDKELRNKFTGLAVCMFLALTVGAVDVRLTEIGDSHTYRYAIKSIKYLCEGYMEVTVLRIMARDYAYSKKKIIWLPMLVISLILMTAPINPHIYYFTSEGIQVRGPLGYLVFVQAAIYMFMALIVCINKWVKGYQRDSLIILFMLAVVSVGVFLEEALIYNNCILTSSSIGVFFVYVYIYAERYNVDSVSMCYKRRCFYADAAKYARTEMAIISMDLNDLKYINDNFGHKAGDIALLTFAEVCRSVKTNKFILYRTGGDEFMILGINATKVETEKLIFSIREKLKETPYTCSFGLHMYKPGEDFDDAVVEADKAMYDDKHKYKASKTKRAHSRNPQFEEKVENFSNDIEFLE